jgi:DNA-binding protein Fis
MQADPGDLTLAAAIRAHVLSVYEHTGRNKVRTAKLLGIDRTTLYDHLWRYGMHDRLRARG